MFGLVGEKKLREILSEFRNDISHEISESEKRIAERLSIVEKSLEEGERRGRRYRKTTDETLARIEAKPLDALMNFAENFALSHKDNENAPGMLREKLDDVLSSFGLGIIGRRGEMFDPELHEACTIRCESDNKDGSVIDIVRAGFSLHGKILRPAVVVVNRHENEENISDDRSGL